MSTQTDFRLLGAAVRAIGRGATARVLEAVEELFAGREDREVELLLQQLRADRVPHVDVESIEQTIHAAHRAKFGDLMARELSAEVGRAALEVGAGVVLSQLRSLRRVET